VLLGTLLWVLNAVATTRVTFDQLALLAVAVLVPMFVLLAFVPATRHLMRRTRTRGPLNPHVLRSLVGFNTFTVVVQLGFLVGVLQAFPALLGPPAGWPPRRPARRHRGGDRRLGGRLGGAVPRVRQELWGDHGRHRHDLGAPEHVPDARPPARCSVRDRPAVPHPRRLAARRLLRGAPRRGVVDRDRCAAVRVREPRPLVRSGRRLARGPAARRAGGLRQRDRLRVGLRARAGTQGHLRRLPGRPPTGGGDVFSLRYVAAAKGIRTAAPSCRTARSRRPHRGYHRMHTERAAGLTGPRRHLTIRHHDAREP